MEKDDAFEELGQCIDTLENLIAAMTIPLPADLHVESLKDTLPELKERIKQAYFGLGGEDVWSI